MAEIIGITEKLKVASGNAKSDSAIFEAGKKSLVSDMITGSSLLNDQLCDLWKKFLNIFLPSTFVLKIDTITAGFNSVLHLEFMNGEDKNVPIKPFFLTVTITDPWESTLPVTCDTTHSDCTVTLTFTPQRSGKHEAAVKYLGQKLTSNQTDIFVDSNNPVLKIGGPGNGNGTFNSPRGIAIDDNNCLYVADTGNGLIQKFSAGGEFLSQFRVNENKDHTTFAIALDLNKRLLICTDVLLVNNEGVKGNTMLLFNFEGQLLHTYTFHDVSCPLSIAVNSCGNVFISDTAEQCVFKVDIEWNSIARMGHFKYPGYICIAGDCMVSARYQNCINILDPNGMVKRSIGSSGSQKGQLKNPFGIATDGENIVVADGDNNRIKIFKYDGEFGFTIESKNDPLNAPRGLAITEDGYVYVVDRDNHCLKKYQYRGTPPWMW